MGEHDVTPDVLPPEQHQHALVHRLLPATLAGARPQENPVVLYVVGPPGSGKTALGDLLHQVLNRRGGAVRIGRDFYKAAHHRYVQHAVADCRTAGAKVRPDACRWQEAVEDTVRACRYDAVVESALEDEQEFRASSAAWRRAGYRIEIVAVATAEAWMQLGLLTRFVEQIHDGEIGRYVSWNNLGSCVRALPHVLAVAEAERLADRISVVRRGVEPRYAAELTGRLPASPAADPGTGAAAAVTAAQAEPWGAQETWCFRHGLAAAEEGLLDARVSADQRLAVRRDGERAAALAEPVRRLAQPLSTPPGVAYHRLSADEHKWIFEDLIVPAYLARTVKRADPMAVYVLGQPGAGKSEVALAVRRGMRPGAAHLVGDRLKKEHPDYERLLEETPRGAGAAIREDYRAWMRQAEEWLRRLPGDAVIEAAPGSAESFFARAELFGAGGFPVELAVLGVREADSRQGTMLRYARALQLGIPARLTTRAGHGQCFDAVADIVERVAGHGAITAVTVVRRDGSAVLREELPRAAPRAAAALQAERYRPYTLGEARRFLALHHGLHRALPQHREELQDIAALACPLMPAHLQALLTVPEPVPWPLPLPQPAAGYSPLSSLSRAA